MSNLNVAQVSQLVADVGVEPLIASDDPIVRLMYKGYSAEFGMKTYQTGDTLRIRIEDQPAMPLQQTTMVVDPIVQQEISATVLNWTTGWNVQSAFEALSLGGKDRLREILAPRTKNMATQAALICYDQLLTCPGAVVSIAAGTAVNTAADLGKFRASLKDQLAMTGLYCVMSPDDMAEVSGDLAKSFNPSKDSSVAYLDGEVSKAAGFNIYETPNMPVHINGTAAASGASGMYLSVNPTSGATSITVAGGTTSGTITEGSIIYIPGVYEINPQTKQRLPRLRAFTVTAATQLSGGGGVIDIFPPLVGPENPKLQTCSTLPVVDGTSTYVAIYGQASGVYRQMLFMRKNSSAFISVKQDELIRADNGMANFEGVIVQTAANSSIENRQNLGRIDLLATARNTQWRHQYRAFTSLIGTA